MSNKEKPPDAGLHAAVACNKLLNFILLLVVLRFLWLLLS